MAQGWSSSSGRGPACLSLLFSWLLRVLGALGRFGSIMATVTGVEGFGFTPDDLSDEASSGIGLEVRFEILNF